MVSNKMKCGILMIGFEYSKSKKWKTLPGISVDLYQAYQYFNTLTKHIMVFTDMKTDHQTSVLQNAILNGYVDSGLLSFVEDMKESKQYTYYKSKTKNNYTINNFDKTVKNFIENVDKLIIYYTGHGKNGKIILPDNTQVGLDYVRDLINSNKVEIISIFDCCQSNGMKLPYRFIKNRFKLNTTHFTSGNIISISSSQVDDDSETTQSGSVFTRILFQYLKQNKNIISIFDIYTYLKKHIKTTTIDSSYPNTKLLFNWFVSDKYIKNNISINVDTNNSVIKIKLNNCQPTLKNSASMKDYIRYHNTKTYH